jgi:hypothetical protein
MAASPDNTDDDLQPEYDFRTMRGVVRGKYTARYRERLRVVRLAEDVAGAFTDEAAVNAALREYLRTRPSSGKAAEQTAPADAAAHSGSPGDPGSSGPPRR